MRDHDCLTVFCDDSQCIILKVDLGCCRGCRERIYKSLKRIEGVKEVKIGDDGASIVVCGKGFNEAEIVGQVKKRKGRSGVEVVSRLHHNSPPNINGSASTRQASPHDNSPKPNYGPALPPCGAPDAVGGTGARGSPKPKYQPPPCITPDGVGGTDAGGALPVDVDTNRSMKGDTLVTERVHKEFEGTKIRTRVTTSEDACTCIRVEETRFIIDKQHRIKGISCTEKAFDLRSSNSLACHDDASG